ncbi:MAG TPA: class I SAM-dependent methyltransferase [Arenimonas sp.]|uniref:class I SAM-dependent methyltransferase n=1 Tax=Arenimonas sp. TaxID=1872635 RepID=UPI002D7F2CF1|nr:class I SAM-dependent methyltransferase [Arenimonas sp.]HEU0151896.1 class I SAM-dependent methyltransferase [Arenimonas sp.]
MAQVPVMAFTGERYTPERDREIAQEHWHRYAFARPLAAGRRVLDAACGEGYGSAMIAAAGGQVLGLDIGEDVVAHARARYGGTPGLAFAQADVTALDHLPDASFDLVLSFETLEHVEAQERMLDGFARLLAPGGLLLVSTPDRHVYTDLTGVQNPHHVRELYRPEFEALLAGRFPARRLFGQKLLFQSVLWSLDGATSPAQAFSLDGQAIHDGVANAPMYFLAACARDAAALAALPALSVFGDQAEGVYEAYRREVVNFRNAMAYIAHLEAELKRRQAPE